MRRAFRLGRTREGDHLEDTGVDGRIIKVAIEEVVLGGMDWIDVARDRQRWRALVDAVTNFRVL
jgi:hypothetical protein